MLGRRKEPETPKILDVDASFQGNLVFKDAVHLRINGHFEGRLQTKGDLLISENAVVKATIVGEKITIAGTVTGDVTALAEIHLTPSARVTGNLKAPSLVLDRGSVFEGQSSMLAENDRPEQDKTVNGRKIFLTTDEMAHYLSVETDLVSEWAETGKLPGDRADGGWRFDKEKVDEWIANGRIT